MGLSFLASSPSFKRSVRVAVCGLVLGGAALSAGSGCGATGPMSDIITFAGEARDQGIKLYNAGQYAEAAGSFQSAIRQRPQDYQSYYYLGRTYEAMKNYHQAVGQYVIARRLMASTLQGEADKDYRLKVIEGLGQAIGLGADVTLEQAAFAKTGGPVSADDHYILAKARRVQGDADAALAEYRTAGQMAPKDLTVAKEHGLYLAQLRQRDAAVAELKRAYALNYRQRNAENDEQINAALQQLGVVPGPSLAEQRDLSQPLIPQGPIPNLRLTTDEGQASTGGQQ
ncbi:MAG TPA: tetratricopeptide repeat protein [Humisphaera sp.]